MTNSGQKLGSSVCPGLEQLYGREACTPNLYMHCHLKEFVLDVGPLHCFWCFSFERYYEILEKMKMSLHVPEVQLIYKFSSLQTLAGVVLPENAPVNLLQCLIKLRSTRLLSLTLSLIAFLF